MSKTQKIILLLLRLSLGWLLLYAGFTKVLNPEWTAAGYLRAAKSFTPFFNWLASSSNIGWVNFANEWGLTLVGVAIIVGLYTRWAALAGMVLMALYYVPILDFPHAGANSYIVDEHIIYILGFALLYVFNAGRFWGLDAQRRY